MSFATFAFLSRAAAASRSSRRSARGSSPASSAAIMAVTASPAMSILGRSIALPKSRQRWRRVAQSPARRPGGPAGPQLARISLLTHLRNISLRNSNSALLSAYFGPSSLSGIPRARTTFLSDSHCDHIPPCHSCRCSGPLSFRALVPKKENRQPKRGIGEEDRVPTCTSRILYQKKKVKKVLPNLSAPSNISTGYSAVHSTPSTPPLRARLRD